MATILRGKRKGEVVEIHQFANDWVSLEDGTILSPTSLEYTYAECLRISRDRGKGDWHYVWVVPTDTDFGDGMPNVRLRKA